MSFLLAGAAVVTAGVGVAKAISGGIKAKKAKEEAIAAQKELDKQKTMFASLDTSNPYLNMQNTMEDITINQQEAEFMKQQQMQQQANLLQQMRQSAGSSGIAALAQTLVNQGSIDAQKASISIGKQESANQLEIKKEAGRLQDLQREGELISRQAEHGKISGMMGMTADEISNAKLAQKEYNEQMWAGMSDVGKAGMSYAGGGAPLGGTTK